MDVELTEVEEVASPGEPSENTIVYRMTETGTHSVYVLTNNTDGFTTTVTGSDGGGTAASVDTARFEIKGGALGDWTAVSTSPDVLENDTYGLSSATDIKYRYNLRASETPNDSTNAMKIALTYTATTK